MTATKRLDLNCDLGEHEAPTVTRQLMRQVTSANIACGGHAGTLASMQLCLRLAKEFGVRAGAHPGLADRENFGRDSRPLSPSEFEILLVSQISGLDTLAKKEGVRLRHVKLHGALYHMVEKEEALGKTYLKCVKIYWPTLAIRAIAGGKIVRLAEKMGLAADPELFADRSYTSPLVLTPRAEAGAVLNDENEISQRIETYLANGTWPIRGGSTFQPQAGTLCVHGDTPDSVKLIRKLRKLLSQRK